MSNVSQFPARTDRCTEEAGDWVARMGDGLTPEQELEFGAWLSRSKRNYDEFMALAQLWDSMDSLSRLADICPEPSTRRIRSGVVTKWLVAATVLAGISAMLLIGANGLFDRTSEAPAIAAADPVIEYETAIGEQGTYVLPDGTEIVLNTNSHVVVNFTSTNRLIKLFRGEIHVSVAHDTSRRLSVLVGDRVFQAVGTEFNLEITGDQGIELLVSEGVVIVGVIDTPVDDTAAADMPIILTPSSTLIAAGQEMSIAVDEFDLESIEAEAIESDEIAIKLSWRDGNIIFRGESLEDAVTEIGRYTAVQVVFLDEDSKKVRVAGLFKAGDVQGLLAALRGHFNIAYEWQGDDRILLSAQQ